MAFGYNPEELVLTPEEEEAARQAAAGSTPPPAPPPPYDPAQDTQGMQAQPAPITVAPPVADPATSPEASYQQRAYQDQISQPGPEYTTQTVADPASVPPPEPNPTYSNGGNLVAQNTPPTQPLSSLISRTYETNGPFAPVANLLRHVGVGDLLGQYRRANQAYETGTTSPVPDQKGEALVQDLVDLGHSGLAQALGGLLPGATAASAPYGPPSDQGYATQVAGAGTGERMPGAAGSDTYTPLPNSDRSVPTERERRRVGSIDSWYETPTTPGSMNAPPPDDPRRGTTDLLGAVLGAGRFLANYGPGHRADLGDTLANLFTPEWTPHSADVMKASLNPQSPTALPEPLRWAANLGRYVWYDNPESTPYSTVSGDSSGYNMMDRTSDAYLGNDPYYLRSMALMPEYITRARPLAARIAHAIANLPGPSYSPPFLPGMEPPPPGPDSPAVGSQREHHLYPEPGIYFDDPYIPGPDKGPRRRTA